MTGIAGRIVATVSPTSPVAVLKGIQFIAIAHPLALLGFVGGSLALIGLHDTLRQRRENRLAKYLAELQPENIW